MSLRSFLVSRVAERITSADRQRMLRERAETRRIKSGARHVVDYFHQANDPYSCLLAQALPDLVARYDIELNCHLVSVPADWAAPERQKLDAWSCLDAGRLAHRAGLRFGGVQLSSDVVAKAESALADSLRSGRFIADAAGISTELWSGGAPPPGGGDAASLKTKGDALRAQLGHYLGGVMHYAGEWYWGLDRLHHLEERLAGSGARKPAAPVTPIYVQPLSPLSNASPVSGVQGGDLHFYLSFRSPYTWIATERVKALADAYGLNLRLRFVLPMVMRGLPVPPAKRNYITLDAAREARRVGVPFGRVADPVGKPVERGYSLLPWAIELGHGYEFCHAFMRGVWSQGVDAGSDGGLRQIVEAAGLDWREARPRIGNDAWRAEAESNRQELFGLGLWGVPCFRFGEIFAWGQDRLWVIEDAIRSQAMQTRGK